MIPKENTLAVNGGKAVFGEDELAKLIPQWPIAHGETEEKLLEVFRSGKWGLCGKYEKLLMEVHDLQRLKEEAWIEGD